MAAEPHFLDTNVLLAASDPGRKSHAKALEVFNSWPRRGVGLFASGQIIREYLVVATRDRRVNGLGLSQIDALANVGAFCSRICLLDEDKRVVDRLRDLMTTVSCTGKQVHDANVVATMLVHNVPNLVTSNVADFKRFAGCVAIHKLEDIRIRA